MATLTPYFASGITVGESYTVQTKILGWDLVGNGQFSAFSEYNMAFAITTAFSTDWDGMALSVTLTDKDPDATSGTASVVFDEVGDDNATYSVSEGSLTVCTNIPAGEFEQPASFQFSPSGGGTLVITSATLFDVWVGPASGQPGAGSAQAESVPVA